MVSVLCDLYDLYYFRYRYRYWYKASVFYINCVVTYTKVGMVSVLSDLYDLTVLDADIGIGISLVFSRSERSPSKSPEIFIYIEC
jgi:hypothetical protein